jgi:transposase
MEVVDSRPIGTSWLLDALWRRLEVASAIKKAVDGPGAPHNVERVLFALVANRAIEPMSKLSAAEWASEDAIIAGLPVMDDDQAYRAMDVLAEADIEGAVQESVFFAVAHLLNLEVDLLFFDTTSTYFERDEEEDDTAEQRGFRRYGKSKDHRDDLPQIVIGLAVTREGIPVRVWCRPGNTSDPEQAERDRHQREQAIGRIEAELGRIKAQRERDKARARSGQLSNKAQARAEDAHVRAECALRDHPTLKRWIRQQRNGRLVIDRAKVKAEANLDGKYLLATSDPDITAEDAALGYKNLLEAERGFRDLKSELLLRPVFHRLEHRIRAHVLICWLALLLTRVAERSTGQSWRNIRRETTRLKQVTLTGNAGTITQTTPMRPGQKAIYQALSITPPSRVSAFDPN